MQNAADLHVIAKAGMLIRKPPATCYRAFIEPDMLTQFWLSRASAPLKVGEPVRWDFMVPGAYVQTDAKVLERNKRIEVDWSDGSQVAWTFTPMPERATRVDIEHRGFGGTSDERVGAALDATQGFTIVLCDLKTLLETGESAHLVRDKAVLLQRSA
jgi:uncharacterized protein YndB with AHSA1/START domain